jgi:hypothetical protein
VAGARPQTQARAVAVSFLRFKRLVRLALRLAAWTCAALPRLAALRFTALCAALLASTATTAVFVLPNVRGKRTAEVAGVSLD